MKHKKKVSNIVLRMTLFPFVNENLNKYMVYDKLTDFVEEQKDLHRGLQDGHGNYYSFLDTPRFSSDHESEYTIFDFQLELSYTAQKILNENKHGEVNKFIVSAAKFACDLVRFMWRFPVQYKLGALLLTTELKNVTKLDCIYESGKDKEHQQYQEEHGIYPFTTWRV